MGDAVKLSAPTTLVFLISLVLAILGVLPLLGITIIPSLGISAAWLLALGYIVLAAGCLFKGV